MIFQVMDGIIGVKPSPIDFQWTRRTSKGFFLKKSEKMGQEFLKNRFFREKSEKIFF